jgi:hypothetical protein
MELLGKKMDTFWTLEQKSENPENAQVSQVHVKHTV